MNKNTLPVVERNLFLPALAGIFIVGVWLATRVSAGLWPLWFGLLAILLILPLRLLQLPLRLVCLPLVLMLSILWTQHWLNPPMPAEGRYDTITATVYGDSKVNTSGNVSFTATGVTLDGVEQSGRAYCSIYVSPGDVPIQLTDGMRIRFSGKVYHPDAKENEYDFDFRMWMRQQRLNYGISGIEDVQQISKDTPWTNYAQRISSASYEKLKAVMGERADLAVAMLLGYRNELAQDDAEAFRRAGVAHVMAVSGLHVGILSMALLWLLEKLRLRKKRQIPVIALFLLIYCGLTGFAVASIRAAVMVLLWVVAKAYGRRSNPITVLSAALLIVLAINPLQLFSAGFVLSFLAVGGISLLYPRIMQGMNRILPPVKVKKERKLRYALQGFIWKIKQSVSVSLSAQLGVLLPIAAYYHNVYPYSLLFNLIIVPLTGLLVPLYAITVLAVWIPWVSGWLGAALGAVSAFGSEALLRLVRISNSLPMAEIRVAQPNTWMYIAAFVIAIAVSRFIRASARRRLMVIAAVVVIAAVGSYAQRPPSLRYHQLSVGWADSALIVDGDTTIGIDTGDTGSAMIDRLLAEGRDLDVLILTHLHADHAGGVGAILDEGIHIGQVYLPVDYERHAYDAESLAAIQRLREAGVPIATLAAGDTLAFHETTIDVLWPQAERIRDGIDPNDRSLAMLITLGTMRILSMSDNGMLYERYAAVPADILKVGHHGSRTSSGEAFLETVDPTLAIFSVQADTTQPAQSTLERFLAQGILALRTDEAGEIIIVPEANGYRTYRTRSEASP